MKTAKLNHWHAYTMKKPGTPDYPDERYVPQYYMACGEVIDGDSGKRNFDQLDKHKVTCWKCLIKISNKGAGYV